MERPAKRGTSEITTEEKRTFRIGRASTFGTGESGGEAGLVARRGPTALKYPPAECRNEEKTRLFIGKNRLSSGTTAIAGEVA
jgi:hypothetical protein